MKTHADDYKNNYIREMAEDDFECGHPFDPEDFDNFKEGMLEDTGLEASAEDFDLYFEAFDEVREQANQEQIYDL